MRCPRCQKENPENSRFCIACGLPLTEDAYILQRQANRQERLVERSKRCVSGILKAICYVILFFFIQTAVMGIFGMAYMAGEMADDLSILYGSYDPSSPYGMDEEYIYDMSQKLMDAMVENLSLLTLISGVVTILFLAVFFGIRRKSLFEECRLRPVPIKTLALCALIGSALNVVMSVTISFIPFPVSWVEALESQYANIGEEKNLFLGLLATALVTGLVEEMIFRGLVESRLRRGMPMWAALLLTALIFGACHGTPIAMGYSTLMAVLVSLMAHRRGSILPAVIVHVFFNAAGYWFVTRDTLLVISLYIISIGVLIGSLFLYFRRDTEASTDNENIRNV